MDEMNKINNKMNVRYLHPCINDECSEIDRDLRRGRLRQQQIVNIIIVVVGALIILTLAAIAFAVWSVALTET